MARYLGNLNIRYLISLVEARPVLWDRTMKSYRDKAVTRMAWEEIYRELIEGFDDLEQKLQREIGKAIIRKWWNIRDGFVKSTKREEEVLSAADFGLYNKQSRYVHYDQMQFLLKRKGENETVRDWWKEDASQDYIYDGAASFTELNESSATEEHSLRQDESEKPKHVSKKLKLTVDESALLEEDSLTFEIEEEGEDNSATSSKTKSNSRQSTERINIKQEILDDALFSEEAGTSGHSKAEYQVRSDKEDLLRVLEDPAYRHLSFFKSVIPSLVTLDEDSVLDFQLGVLELIKKIKDKRT